MVSGPRRRRHARPSWAETRETCRKPSSEVKLPTIMGRYWAECSRWLLVGILCVVPGCLGAQQRVTVSPDVRPLSIEAHRLPSGMKLLIERHPNLEVAGAVLLVHAGARWEPSRKGGLSHAVEHLMFRAKKVACGTVEAQLNALGATFNGWTNYELQGYSAFTSARYLDQLLTVMMGMVSDPLGGVDRSVFETERLVLEAERGNRRDSAYGQIYDWLDGNMVTARTRGERETRESLRGLSFEDVADFARANLRRERMTFFLQLPENQPLTVAQRSLLGLGEAVAKPTATFVPSEIPVPEFKAAGTLEHRQAWVPAHEVWLAWPMSTNSIQEVAQSIAISDIVNDVLASALGGSPSSAGVPCNFERVVSNPRLVCRLTPSRTDVLERTVAGILSELQRAFYSRVNRPLALENIRRERSLTFALSEESLLTHAENMALGFHRKDDLLYERHVVEALGSLDQTEVFAKGFELMQRDKTHLLHVAPSSNYAVSDLNVGEELASRGAYSATSCNSSVEMATESTAVSTVRHRRLRNGLEVLVLPMPHTPYVTAQLGIRGGRAWASEPSVAMAAIVGEVTRLPRAPLDYGATLSRKRYPDVQLETARTVSNNLEQAIALLWEAKYPAIEWPNQRYVDSLSAHILADSSVDAKRERALLKSLFGTHPYGASVAPEVLPSIKITQIYRYLTNSWRPEVAALVVVGNVQPEHVFALAEVKFGNWTVQPGVPPQKPKAIGLQANSDGQPQYLVTHRAASKQVSLAWSCLVPLSTTAELMQANLVSSMVQLNTESTLRRDLPLTYSVSSSLAMTASGVAQLRWDTLVEPSHLTQILSLLESKVFNPKREYDEVLFSNALRRKLAGVRLPRSTSSVMADELMRSWVYGLPVDEVPRSSAFISAIRWLDVAQQLEQCMRGLRVSLLGDESELETAIAQTKERRGSTL